MKQDRLEPFRQIIFFNKRMKEREREKKGKERGDGKMKPNSKRQFHVDVCNINSTLKYRL